MFQPQLHLHSSVSIIRSQATLFCPGQRFFVSAYSLARVDNRTGPYTVICKIGYLRSAPDVDAPTLLPLPTQLPPPAKPFPHHLLPYVIPKYRTGTSISTTATRASNSHCHSTTSTTSHPTYFPVMSDYVNLCVVVSEFGIALLYSHLLLFIKMCNTAACSLPSRGLFRNKIRGAAIFFPPPQEKKS